MQSKHHIAERIAGDIGLDMRLVVPAGEIAGDGPLAIEGQNEQNEGPLPGHRGGKPEKAGPAQQGLAERSAHDDRFAPVRLKRSSAVRYLLWAVSPIWKSAMDFGESDSIQDNLRDASL